MNKILIISTDMIPKEFQDRPLDDLTLMCLPIYLHVSAKNADIVLVCNSERVWELKHRYNTERIIFPLADLADYMKAAYLNRL